MRLNTRVRCRSFVGENISGRRQADYMLALVALGGATQADIVLALVTLGGAIQIGSFVFLSLGQGE